ncbi:MAG: hypothetical protein KME55_07255 [Nostoc indistinguendum CM1-VF10]|nr:hypothetical protein [Nostoc indistinguendum CM1-VF10]
MSLRVSVFICGSLFFLSLTHVGTAISAIAISNPYFYAIGKRMRYNQALKIQG